MKGFRDIAACVVLVLLLAGTGLTPVHATQIKSVHVTTDATRTRAVIDLSGPVTYKLFQLSNPGRVVLDFSESSLHKGFQTPRSAGLLKSIRTGHHGKHGLRVVLDLSGKAQPKSFLLKPSDGHGYQLVVELYGDGAVKTGNARQSALRAVKLLNGARKVVVAVDAGHGGVDPGATGPRGTREKDVTLKVAKDLAALIDKQPGMRAVLTRKGNYFVPLKKRYKIARADNADLFISIHADAFRSGDAKGSSVWVLSTHGKVSEAARWLADRQNHADLLGGASLDSSLASTLLDLQQGYSIRASSRVANNVLHALAKIGPTHRDHIERANFVVLRSPDVPSILVETAFITNPEGERKLRSPAYQKKLAKAVLGGVKAYFEHTPPRGTWFAEQARKREGDLAAAGKYHVSNGDTLSSIAQRYGVSVASLKSANSIDNDAIRTGSVLTIPTS